MKYIRTYKQTKLILIPLLLLIASCTPDSSSTNNDFTSRETSVIVSEHISNDVVSESSIDGESNISSAITSDISSDILSEMSSSDITTEISSVDTTSDPSSTTLDSLVPSEPPSSSKSSISEEERAPGIYSARTRIGVAISKTVTIEHEVYPESLGVVTWELIPDPYFGGMENQPASVMPTGEVTGIKYNGDDELLIKGTLLEFEVYVTLMVFFDYDKKVDTFYPAHELEQAIGRGDRYFNGTTMYAGISVYRHTHYYAYDLKAGMTFNIMALTRYTADHPKFYFEFGKVLDDEFVVLTGPFISNDGKALLLGYDVVEDGEYIVRVKPHIEINSSTDEFSYIKYTFWF